MPLESSPTLKLPFAPLAMKPVPKTVAHTDLQHALNRCFTALLSAQHLALIVFQVTEQIKVVWE